MRQRLMKSQRIALPGSWDSGLEGVSLAYDFRYINNDPRWGKSARGTSLAGPWGGYEWSINHVDDFDDDACV